MAEKEIEFRRRVLPENHPTIYAAMDCVAAMYLNLGRHQDALVMAETALEFWRRVLPENHPQIGGTSFFRGLLHFFADSFCCRRNYGYCCY